MAAIYITLDRKESPPQVDVLQIPSGESFIRAQFGDISMTTVALDASASSWARAFAEQLLSAAEAIDAKLLPVEGVMCDDRR